MEKNGFNIREIAKRAGCSASTVSRVLAGRIGAVKISEKTAEKVRKVCAELDYQPSIHAARLFSGKSRVIGFLSACSFMPDDNNFAKSFFHFCEAASAYGYRVLPLLNTEAFRKEKEYLNIFKRGEIDALIVWGAKDSDDFLHEIRDAGYPMLLLTNRVGDFPAVTCEQKSPIEAMTLAASANGAKRIAAIMNDTCHSLIQRQNGFLEAAEKIQGKTRLWHLAPEHDFGLKSFRTKIARILAWKPDALICFNDETAVGVIHYLLEHGIRVPEDLVVSGGDNILLSEYGEVPLTTFDQKAEQCSRTAAKMLAEHLMKGKSLISIEIPSRVIWRKSLPFSKKNKLKNEKSC